MLNKIKNIFFLLSIFSFLFFITSHYLSEQNIIHTNKLRSTFSLYKYEELPILKNDTKNIIVYKNDLNEFKKKRKKRSWEDLISDD
tara:strand:+ start:631 stop:888 length:258 start_codon:yes stop_codon:yes gene_type:complete